MLFVSEQNTSAFVTAGKETPRMEAGVDRDRQWCSFKTLAELVCIITIQPTVFGF